MGFNPFRPQTQRRSDLVFVAVGLAIVVGLLAWAFLAG